MLQNLLFITHYLFAVRAGYSAKVDAVTIDSGLKHLNPNTKVVSDKYPDYAFFLDKLVQVDGLKPIFIYRDLRDLASSVAKVSRTIWHNTFPEKLRDPKNVANRWVKSIERMERHANGLHIIRYED